MAGGDPTITVSKGFDFNRLFFVTSQHEILFTVQLFDIHFQNEFGGFVFK